MANAPCAKAVPKTKLFLKTSFLETEMRLAPIILKNKWLMPQSYVNLLISIGLSSEKTQQYLKEEALSQMDDNLFKKILEKQADVSYEQAMDSIYTMQKQLAYLGVEATVSYKPNQLKTG